MRRFDKNKNIKNVNLLAEQRYLESKNPVNENFAEIGAKKEAMKTINNAKHVNELINSVNGEAIEIHYDENKPILHKFQPMNINEEGMYINFKYEISTDGGETWRPQSKSRSLTEKTFNGAYSYETQNGDNRLIATAIQNHKDGMATRWIDAPQASFKDTFKLRPIEKQL